MENNIFFNFNSPSSMSNYNTRGTLNPPYTYSPNYTAAARIYNFDRNNPTPNNIEPIDPLLKYKQLITISLDTSTNTYITSRLTYDVATTTLSSIINELIGTTILSLEIVSVLNTETREYVNIPPEDVSYNYNIKTAVLTINIIGFETTYDLIANLISSVTETLNLNVELYYAKAIPIVVQLT